MQQENNFCSHGGECCALMECMTHGAALAALRIEKGWRQADLSRASGLSISLISKLERAETLSGLEMTWRCLSQALGFDNVEQFQRELNRRSTEIRGLFVTRPLAEAVQAAADRNGMSLEEWLKARCTEKAQVVVHSTSPKSGAKRDGAGNSNNAAAKS
jgi:transcriptional regulator with XRE-family HTH domain